MPCPKIGATHNYAQLVLPDKCRAINGWLFSCVSWDISAFEHVKWSGSTFLSTLPWI